MTSRTGSSRSPDEPSWVSSSSRHPSPQTVVATQPDRPGPSKEIDIDDSNDGFLPKGQYDVASVDEGDRNFNVVIRVRPPLPRELHSARTFKNVVQVDRSARQITLSEDVDTSDPGRDSSMICTKHSFTFDHVYNQDDDQESVYESTAKAAVMSTLKGYNASVIAYGQTGTGKTYTMEGLFDDQSDMGIIPRAIQEIFQFIQVTASPSVRFLVRASYLQIYNEVISDLLKPDRNNLQIREDKKRGIFVEGLSEWVVRSPKEIYGLMRRGAAVRATGSTKLNEISSRSHAVFVIIVEQNESSDTSSFKVGKLNLVDLAGSERVRVSGATGQRLEESKKINQSLSALGNVISALTESRRRAHIPYRDSRLTRILEDSLGGNCRTTMMAMISPALEAFSESLSTLKFANRAKNIQNEATINEDLDEKALLRRYECELKRLRNELAARSRNVVDKRKLIEVEEQRRRAERDKMAAIIDLERLSRDLAQEKQEKQELENRIREMTGQLLIGGSTHQSGHSKSQGFANIEQSPEFQAAVEMETQKIVGMYNDKFEKEMEWASRGQARVDRYKTLLIKQRDIMIQLTARLNERDQSIVCLQEELDAYDTQQRAMEDALDQKTATLIRLQKVAMEVNASAIEKNPKLMEALGVWGDSPQPSVQNELDADSNTKMNRLVRDYSTAIDQNQSLKSEIAELVDAHKRELDNLRTHYETRNRLGGTSNGRGHNIELGHLWLEQQAPDRFSQIEFDNLKSQMNAQLKERVALRTILENKMKYLVDNIDQGINEESTRVPEKTRKEVDVLRRLINAALVAIRYSDAKFGIGTEFRLENP